MRSVWRWLVSALALTITLNHAARAADPSSEESTPCASFEDFKKSACPLTWHGITIYGAVDVGVGWVSHGLPSNGYNYEGQSLINRNGNHPQWLIEPNGLSQSGVGIKGRLEILQGWFGVFNASTGINPQSGQLANMAATNTTNNGLPRESYSVTGDGARAGQTFNDEFYAGLSSPRVGTLTFGRQRSLGTDTMLAYDPSVGAYAFSYIGYNGTMAGGGDTQDTRWDQALKYRVGYGPVHFGAMYKFVDGSGGCYSAAATWTVTDCTPEQPHNTAYGFNLGGTYANFAADITYQHYNQAISVVNPLLGPQSLTQPYQSTINSINTNPITGADLISTTNTEYGIVTDNDAVMLAAKYAWEPFRFYVGYEHVRQTNPSSPLGVGASAQGGYLLSGVEDNNLDSPKIVQIWWTGVKYALDSQTDLTLSTTSNRTPFGFRRPASPATCAAPARATSTSFRPTSITTSPSASTLMAESPIQTSAGVWRSPFRTGRAFRISMTATLRRQSEFDSSSDSRRGQCGAVLEVDAERAQHQAR